jgi:uncharacterized protein involved in exopolysaccharide biosynthesis
MAEAAIRPDVGYASDDQISVLGLATGLLRHRRAIIGWGLGGALIGLVAALLSTRTYMSTATFIPQGAETATSGLALAASQFGIRVPTSGGGWGPAIYVELLGSRALLDSIAKDTVVVVEEGNRRVALMDLLKIKAPTPARRTERAARVLAQQIVGAAEDRRLGAVRLSVKTRWPSVSLVLAQQLVHGVNQFNLLTRKSQASAERQFAEVQEGEAERALRDAEDRLQYFLQSNRAISGSPELNFQRDRLQREITLRQQIYSSLVQSREEARLREVRDTPVITVLEDPRLPVLPEPRGALLKTLVGGIMGVILGVLVAFVSHNLSVASREPTSEASEFFRLMHEATPRFLRRKSGRKAGVQ